MQERHKPTPTEYKQSGIMTNILFGSRWLQLPLYLGLIIAQAVYVFFFGVELVHLVGKANHLVEADIMLIVLGLIGGGPTFVGTLIGQAVVNDVLSIGFLALAAGSILYVVIQLLRVVAKWGRRELLCWSILLGLFLGFATDFVIVAAGA